MLWWMDGRMRPRHRADITSRPGSSRGSPVGETGACDSLLEDGWGEVGRQFA